MQGVRHHSGSYGLFPFGNEEPTDRASNKVGNKEKELITSVRVQLPNGEMSPPDQIDRGGDTRRAVRAYVPRQKLHATIFEA